MSTEFIIGYFFVLSAVAIFVLLAWQSIFKSRKAAHLMIFLLSTIVTALHFHAEPFPHAWHSALPFPFLPSFALLIGPSLYLHAKAHQGKLKLVEYYHYAPAAFVMIDSVLYAVFKSQEYSTNYNLMMQGDITLVQRSFSVPGHFIMRHYTLVVFAYASFAFIQQMRNRQYFTNGITILTGYLTLAGPLAWLFIKNVLDTGSIANTTPFEIILQASMVLTNPLILWHSALFVRSGYPTSALSITEDNGGEVPPISEKSAKELKEKIHSIRAFIKSEMGNSQSLLLQVDVKKDAYLAKTPFTTTLWQTFFDTYNIKFGDLKRCVRIARAQEYVAQDFLDLKSVDDLSVSVGYRSRTSFYSAFEEVVGIKFSVYRAEYSLRKMKPNEQYNLQDPIEKLFST